MLGRDHAALGITTFGAAAWVGATQLGLPALTAPQAALGIVVSAGAALAPDLDERHSTAGRDNPISWLPLFGGHRRRTHCLLAVALVAGVAVLCQLGHDSTVILVGFAACTGAGVLLRRLSGLGVVLGVPFGIAGGWVAANYVPGGWWLIAAVAIPYASHLVGDGVTPGGLPLLLPFSQRKFSAHLFRTGGVGERLVVSPLLHLLELWALWAAFMGTATAYATTTIASIHWAAR